MSNTKTLNLSKTMRIAFASANRHEKATRQAYQLAATVADFLLAGGMKVEIEVISQETFELRSRVRDLERQLGINPSLIVVDEI